MQRKAKTERSLIGCDRIMPVLRGPLPNDEPSAVLNRERAAELQEVQSAIGASGELAGEVIGYDRKAEHCLREGQSVSGARL